MTAQLDARLGENMPDLAQEARQKIGEALARMTGLTVTGWTSSSPASSLRYLTPRNAPAGRRSARRQAVFILYQRDLLGLTPQAAIARATDGGVDAYTRSLVLGVDRNRPTSTLG